VQDYYLGFAALQVVFLGLFVDYRVVYVDHEVMDFGIHLG